MPTSGPPLERSIELVCLLENGLRSKPDEPALVSFESRWTWRELDEASRRVAGHYLGLGLKPGDRVASLMPNRGALLVHYLACIRAGLVATPLNYRYQAPEIDHALEVSGASVIVAHAERDADLAQTKLAGGCRWDGSRLGRRMAGGRTWKSFYRRIRGRSIYQRRGRMRRCSFTSRRAAPASRKALPTRTKRTAGWWRARSPGWN